MNFSFNKLTALLALVIAVVVTPATVPDTAALTSLCPRNGETLTLTGSCSDEILRDVFESKYPFCDFETVGELTCPHAVSFADISNRGYQFDKNYFDGGASYNTEKETHSKLTTDAGRIVRAEKIVKKRLVAWPEYEAVKRRQATAPKNGYLANFNLDQNCDLNTVMCCFTHNRYVDGPIKRSESTSDVCKHNLGTSARSTHINDGWAVYDGREESSPYCVGFSWDPAEESTSNRFKGNTLFYTSFMNTLKNGYTINIPGAPMCSCIEHMPVVTKADCLDVKVTSSPGSNDPDFYLFTYNEATHSFDGEHHASVSVVPCEKDFVGNFEDKNPRGNVRELMTHIVGEDNCDDEGNLNEKFYTTAAMYDWNPPETNWTKVAGLGFLYRPMIGDRAFREAVYNSPNGIIYRRCLGCYSTHKHIYYKRFTPYPENKDFLDLFMNNWFSEDNEHGKDMCLFSTYEEALAAKDGQANGCWKFCNYNHEGVGFPRDCGPLERTNDNWNRYYIHGPFSTHHHAFYVEAWSS